MKIFKKFLIIYFIGNIAVLYTQQNPNQKEFSFISDTEKSLILLSPRGTETFYYDDELKIVWDFSNVKKINIDYLDKQNNWIKIATEIDAQIKKYNWIIPTNVPQTIKIRILDSEDSNYQEITQFFIRVLSKSKTNLMNESSKIDKISTTSVLKIMPLGDSITEGYFADPLIVRNSYRKKLKELLEKSGLNFDFVGSLNEGDFTDNQHEGHGGYSAKHFAGNKPDIYDSVVTFLTNTPPDVILLHIGTNDINDFRYSGDLNVANTTVADVSSDLDLIYAFDPDIIVILAKIINRTDDLFYTPSFNESVATSQFNISIGTMVDARAEFGTKLFLVDMESALIYPTDLQDNLHPNNTGYEKMAPVWLNGIRNVLPKLSAKIFLEGAYSGSNSMSQSLKTAGVIPTTQPFNTASWNYAGTEDAGTIPTGVVDWVLVSLRTGTDKSSEVACRAGFLKTDGTIVDLDGTSALAFVVDQGSYYVVVEHRNHLPVMSAAPVLIQP